MIRRFNTHFASYRSVIDRLHVPRSPARHWNVWRIAAFAALVLSADGNLKAGQLDVVADSVAQFSDVQGQNNWYYGYVAPASGPEFIPFSTFDSTYPGGPAWVIDPLPPTPPWPNDYYFTLLWADRGMDNGLITSQNKPAEQWDDRRWSSTVSGTISISGLFGLDSPGANPEQDGVFAQILVDGTPVWSLQAGADYAVSPYATLASVSVGSIVDFVVQPGANDFLDEHTFTAVIQTPEPASVTLAGLAATILWFATRRWSASRRCPSV
jgi:hypothetical protein